MRTASPLILDPSKLRTSEDTCAHHRKGDAVSAAESALILSSRIVGGGLEMVTVDAIFVLTFGLGICMILTEV
jgi:hypothetical protein